MNNGEYEDSELVKKIKSYGILTEYEDIELVKKIKSYGTLIVNDISIQGDIFYRIAYVNKRDKMTVENLKNECVIEFRLHDGKEVNIFNYDTFINKIYEEEDYDNIGDNLVFYDNFVKTMDVNGLIYENEIILKCSYINVWFKYPMHDRDVTFKIMADNTIDGFTMKELVLKVMQRYHMLVFMWQNYDIKQGIINPGVKNCFQPFMYDCDWLMNGVVGLEYNKEKDIWMVMLNDIH